MEVDLFEFILIEFGLYLYLPEFHPKINFEPVLHGGIKWKTHTLILPPHYYIARGYQNSQVVSVQLLDVDGDGEGLALSGLVSTLMMTSLIF